MLTYGNRIILKFAVNIGTI